MKRSRAVGGPAGKRGSKSCYESRSLRPGTPGHRQAQPISEEVFATSAAPKHVTRLCDRQPSPLVESAHSVGATYHMSVSYLPHVCNGRHSPFVI